MKRIALFCDGTWSDPNSVNPTNVRWLFESVAPSDGAVAQEAEYFSGVGVEENKLTGGIWGVGLDKKVHEAYRRLCELYEVGDEIYLFGFSRGAYTARSICGLLRKCGVVRRDAIEQTERAMELYRRRDSDGPDSAQAQAFRNAYCAAYVDQALVDVPGDRATPELLHRMLRVRYLGIWDTVGALGVPSQLPLSSMINRKYRFHDLALSRTVEWARHAMAIDETRNAFEPAPWTQESLIAINRMHREYRVEQDWFPGDHGSVGGGIAERKLSDCALLWVAEGAARAGLKLDDHGGHLAKARTVCDPVHGPLYDTPDGAWLTKLRGQSARKQAIPQVLVDVSEGAQQRMRETQDYVKGDSREVKWRRITLANIVRIMGL
jgi:uncharacterized protein (DUF2235 family)